MKERPILMATESVKAILEGRKTQTRRIIKAQPIGKFGGISERFAMSKHCPYGQIGDRLWVRESWRIESFMDGEPLLFGYKDGQTMEENEYSDTLAYESWYERVCIQSTDDAKKAFKQGLVRQDEGDIYHWDTGKSPCRWRPSIFMPRWASRITLEITEVRVERVAEITEEDAEKEGVSWSPVDSGENPEIVSAVENFANLWDSLNAKRGYSWESNCWVWVISFKVRNDH